MWHTARVRLRDSHSSREGARLGLSFIVIEEG